MEYHKKNEYQICFIDSAYNFRLNTYCAIMFIEGNNIIFVIFIMLYKMLFMNLSKWLQVMLHFEMKEEEGEVKEP